ncbi:hypothetical protein CHLRE_16g689199v5 [Chlamydomonas reinhardtii]|uniref:Uncharacterized protein n=1 Tax=Chlamydomonas reinhardtii TaxID=3055 RepID=A0A2K3CW73_CHLRE|nr:uncharacterized protein CHLRE_16g689199v5 [Chlamydomonas reinhardtii]PNW72534.1 hypothetical protein CHLRE_16g689199v5 [Chlamydomonas reinhardtii]
MGKGDGGVTVTALGLSPLPAAVLAALGDLASGWLAPAVAAARGRQQQRLLVPAHLHNQQAFL